MKSNDPNLLYKTRNKGYTFRKYVWTQDKILHLNCTRCGMLLMLTIPVGESWVPGNFECPACHEPGYWSWPGKYSE